jgi:hypothetical protein
MPHDDEPADRIARLQRLAYGADTPDAERAAAATELAALTDARAAARPPSGDGMPDPDAPGLGSHGPDASEASDATDVPAVSPPTPPGDARARPRLRALLAASAGALVVGIATGWALGNAQEPSEGADVGIPVAETTAWEVFDRPMTRRDFVRYPAPLVDIGADVTSRRLLLTRSDGVRLVAVRTADGEDACLVLALPAGRPATACTEGGRFPGDGLRAEISVQGVVVYLAAWDADGRASINTASAAAD